VSPDGPEQRHTEADEATERRRQQYERAVNRADDQRDEIEEESK
jgi:hypothetical protein